MTNNNNNEINDQVENIKNKINKIKNDKVQDEQNRMEFLKLSSRPTYLIGGIFGGAALYYNLKQKKTLAKFSLISSGLLMFSGHLIDNNNENVGSILAGGVSAILSGTTLASSFKNKKILPLALGSCAVASMGYHAFFSLYNSLDQVKDLIDDYNENIKLKKSENNNK